MSDHKHTKGPWRFYVEEDSDTRMGKIGVTGGIYDVAHCFGDSEEREACEANARLIAAAPDLLKVCEDILRNGHDSKNDERLAVVIAKATGQEVSE